MKSGRELDALVAEKVFGMHRHPGCDLDDHLRAECYGTGTEEGYGPVVDYSTDIAAAWQVVEKLRSDGLGIILNDTMGQYRGRFWRYDRSDGWDIDAWILCPDTQFTVWEETAPLVICLAALKALGVEVEE